MKEARESTTRINSKTIVVVCFVLIIFFLAGIFKEAVNSHKINQQIAKLESQANELEKQNQEISTSIDDLSRGSQLEKEARLKLGLQKPGEKVVIILRDEIGSEERTPTGKLDEDDGEKGGWLANPKKWWQYFFK